MANDLSLYTAEESRAIDKIAIENFEISGFELMRRAGFQAYKAILQRWPNIETANIICGKGNNAGDGFIVAKHLSDSHIKVNLILLFDEANLKGSALKAYQQLKPSNVNIEKYQNPKQFENTDLIVDAMLGTGSKGKLSSPFPEIISAINQSKAKVVALDIPTGLNADTGSVTTCCVNADLCVTFITRKIGLYTAKAYDYCGVIDYQNLGVSHKIFQALERKRNYYLRTARDIKALLPIRTITAHKGDFGHVLIIGGNIGMGGAAILAAEAALRCGCGKVSLICHQNHINAALSRCPEVMALGTEDIPTSINKIKEKIQQASTIVIGPGLGLDDWATSLFHLALMSNNTKVIDADALSLISRTQLSAKQKEKLNASVITPHPGEAAKLLQTKTINIQNDRFSAINSLVKTLNTTVLLKGAGTLVQSPSLTNEPTAVEVCHVGNSGMASAGMGDVLSGIIASFLAQGLSSHSATLLGALIHGHAADLAIKELSQASLMASDVIKFISASIKEFESS